MFDVERWLSYKGTCHVILLAKLHDMYLYKTDNFFHINHYLKSVSKVALLHRFYCSTILSLCVAYRSCLIFFFQHHEKTTDEKKRTLKDLEKTIKQKDNENEQLLKELEDLNVSVHERRHIEEVNGK